MSDLTYNQPAPLAARPSRERISLYVFSTRHVISHSLSNPRTHAAHPIKRRPRRLNAQQRVEREKDPRLTKVIAFFLPFKPIVLPAFLAGVPVVPVEVEVFVEGVPVEVEVLVEGISVEVELELEVGLEVELEEVGVEEDEVEVAERVERAMTGWSISTYSLSL
jgi:hypothetical protein